MPQAQINQQIAEELNVRTEQVAAAIHLIDQGSTIPFIARYRKEVTEGLDDTQLRNLDSRLSYLRELEERRATILKSISEQGKLTNQLEKEIALTNSKTRLEDLYLPYKPKRITKGQIAKEAGLEPLATLLWSESSVNPEKEAEQYINVAKGILDTKAALDGARFILMEKIAENADLISHLRQYLTVHAEIVSQVVKGKELEGQKFKDYFDHHERLSKVPSHRALAMFRGRNEGFLQLSMNADPVLDDSTQMSYCETLIAEYYGIHLSEISQNNWRKKVVNGAWRLKISAHMETELMKAMKERSEVEAIEVFATNLKDLLMAAPAGPRITLGLDPGLRTGSKIAVVDSTGKVLDTEVIYPHPPQHQIDKSARVIEKLILKYHVDLIAIGNGTASRETDEFIANTLKKANLSVQKIIVSETGASVYSASELAAKEFPNMDVSLRGAVSIARRLQDPLAELVKIDPKSIGVGQYQHDVNQSALTKRLNVVIEDCVNAVGVDVNTASAALLTHVAGLSSAIADNIVKYRDENGRFETRTTLKKVPRLGPKAFEQSAGFLRIMNGKNPLDSSAVHPEAYPVVKMIAEKNQKDIKALIGDTSFLCSLNAHDYTNSTFGLPTVTDIIKELDKPGRDPRPEFKTATFTDGINKISDLEAGMILEGVVSNVANFGAFVDIGVHQDGLVHISALTTHFVSDPREVVKAGDIVKVKVMEVEVQRKRIALSMRLNDELGQSSAVQSKRNALSKSNHRQKDQGAKSTSSGNNTANSALADAFKRAKK